MHVPVNPKSTAVLLGRSSDKFTISSFAIGRSEANKQPLSRASCQKEASAEVAGLKDALVGEMA